MKTIKGLIKKDIFNLASYKMSLLILLICMCVMGMASSSMVNYIPIIAITMVGMIALSTFSYDDISKSNTYILSLPTNKKEIVLSKYIFIIAMIIIGGILGVIITPIVIQIMNAIHPEEIIAVDFHAIFITTLGGMFGISLVEAIQIPSIYKWGAEKGKIQMFILIFALILLIVGIGYLVTKIGIGINMEMIQNFLDKFGIPILIISIIMMHYISYKVSYKIYCKKES